MAQNNAGIVRSILGSWERGELSSLEWAAPEIEFVFADGPEPGRHVGRKGMQDLFRGWLGSFAEFGISVEDVIDLDRERVLALTSVRGQGKTSGVDLARAGSKTAHLFELHAGRVTRLVVYFQRELALAELGVGPQSVGPAS